MAIEINTLSQKMEDIKRTETQAGDLSQRIEEMERELSQKEIKVSGSFISC